MQELLDSYPNRKIVLTGAKKEDFQKLGLDNVPYEIFTLNHNPEKTDPSYYERMLEHFGLSVDDVVYFEHGKEAFETAKSVGINTYFYDSEKKDLAALKAFLDESL
jgi:FMN phosphatase YigB (HAD superfamily)